MTYTYAVTPGEARSCLAALADLSDNIDMASHFERLLIKLDILTDDVGPACSQLGGTAAELLRRLECAVDRLVEYGVDGLSLELLLVCTNGGPLP